jgi:hypothetical protein
MRRKRKIADTVYVVLRNIPEKAGECDSVQSGIERTVDVWVIYLTQEEAEFEAKNRNELAEEERMFWRFWWVEAGWPTAD